MALAEGTLLSADREAPTPPPPHPVGAFVSVCVCVCGVESDCPLAIIELSRGFLGVHFCRRFSVPPSFPSHPNPTAPPPTRLVLLCLYCLYSLTPNTFFLKLSPSAKPRQTTPARS